MSNHMDGWLDPKWVLEMAPKEGYGLNMVAMRREHYDALREQLAEHERLHAELNTALHPNGDGPTNPSLCDLVAYARGDKAQRERGALRLVLDAAREVMRYESEGGVEGHLHWEEKYQALYEAVNIADAALERT